MKVKAAGDGSSGLSCWPSGEESSVLVLSLI